ncbi:MAG: hypothetical protein WDZ31_02825 [Phycisphaeraceae bacterium]
MQTQDIIIYGIAAIILVGSWVANLLRKQAEERQERERIAGGGKAASKPSLDELAARRREELRELARQRGEVKAGPVDRPGAGEPVNLSMAERIARARAKAQYEERAARMGGGGRAAPSPAKPTPAPAPARTGPSSTTRDPSGMTEMERARQRDLQRRQAEARKRQEAERRAHAEQQRRAQQRELERQRAHQQAEQRQRRAEQEARQRAQQSVGVGGPAVRPAAVQRPSAYTIKAKRSGGSIPFTTRSLREAILLREVFDRPLAMRDPLQDREF